MNITLIRLRDFIRSLFWKRDKGILLFGAWFGDRFADNPRYLFQYLSDNKKILGLKHVVWVTRNEKVVDCLKSMGYEVYLMNSDESIYFHKHSKYQIVCDNASLDDPYPSEILGRYSYGAIKINLWHGVMPIKGICLESNEYKIKRDKHRITYKTKEFLFSNSSLYRTFFSSIGDWGNAYFLSSTPEGTKTFKKVFNYPLDHYIETLYPRFTKCLRFTSDEQKVLDIIKKYKYSILYAPTFRDKNSSFHYENTFIYIKEQLEGQDILFIQKAHAAEKRGELTQNFKNLLTLNASFDLNSIIPEVSAIMTDYSTIAADAIYYKKPIIYYTPDLDEYASGGRGFLHSPTDIMVSKPILDIETLKKTITELSDMIDDFEPSPKYDELQIKYVGLNKDINEIWTDIVAKASK